MRGMFGGRAAIWPQILKRLSLQARPFCNTTKQPTSTATTTTTSSSVNSNGNIEVVDGSKALTKHDAYKELHNLDFMKAAKILFSDPPNKKKFGLDFHLVQLFFVCMPSLAVYLVAQYARYEMRRMEAELEQKKQAEEEARAKEIELKAAEEEAAANPELFEVKVRLEKLEETVKEIVVETKKQSGDSTSRNNFDSSKQERPPSKETTTASHQEITNRTAPATASTQNLDAGQSKGSSHYDKK